MPAYNEEENLPVVFRRISEKKQQFAWDCEFIIVNDGSSDRTPKIAGQMAKEFSWVRVIHRKKGINGMGAALKDGTKAASSNIIVWIMADLSDDLNGINIFLKKIEEENSDLVFASRFIEGGSPGDTFPIKALASFTYTFVTKVLFGIKVHDITNAFRAFTKEVSFINLESNDFAISPEQAIKAHLKGFVLAEIPTIYKDRVAGEPKFQFLKMGLRYVRLFKYKFVKP